MPGPQKLYPVRFKVSLTEQMAMELEHISELTGRAQADLVRQALNKHLRNMAKAAGKPRAAERRESRRKQWAAELELAWSAYLRAREKWWRQMRNHAPPQEPKLTAKRADLILDSLEANGKETTILAGKGIWLSDFHTDKGFTGPEYAWRPSNVQKFATMVIETRIGD